MSVLSALSDRIHQVETIKMGIGLKFLLTEAYKIFGNPLILFDMEYRLIDYCQETDGKGSVWNDVIENGVFGDQTIAFFKNEGFIDDVATAHTIALIKSDNLSHDALAGKICGKNRAMVASLLLLASNRPFNAYDPVLFEAFCEVLSKEIATIDYYQRYSLTYRDRIISKLIDGDIPDKALFASHAANMYEGFQGYICAGVLDTTEYDPEGSKLLHIGESIKRIQPGLKSSIYSNSIVIILGVTRETINIKRDLSKLHKFFKQKRIYAGISDCFDNIYELSKYYHQAVSALRSGKEYDVDQWIFLHSNES